MIWIILGRVYVSIQMVAMAEAENNGAFFSSPLFSVETFDDTAKGMEAANVVLENNTSKNITDKILFVISVIHHNPVSPDPFINYPN